jgi:hypothetical protein
MLRQFFAARRSRRATFDALVRYVVEASVERVAAIVAESIVNMGLCEARGYIRGRSGLEIRRHARQAVARRADVPADWERHVAVAAAERIAPLVMRRLAAAPPRERQVRRAA